MRNVDGEVEVTLGTEFEQQLTSSFHNANFEQK